MPVWCQMLTSIILKPLALDRDYGLYDDVHVFGRSELTRDERSFCDAAITIGSLSFLTSAAE